MLLCFLAWAWLLARGRESGEEPRGPLGLGGGPTERSSPVLLHILADCSTASAGRASSASHPHRPRKSCKVRRNAGVCSGPQNRAHIVPAFPGSVALVLAGHTDGSSQFLDAPHGVLRCLLLAFWGQSRSNLERHLSTHPLWLTARGR